MTAAAGAPLVTGAGPPHLEALVVAVVAIATAALLGIGVVAFVRRDIGISGTTRTPGWPGTLLGTGGPVRRSFGELLPLGVAWGAGLGLLGLLIAAALVDELARSPVILQAVSNWLPGSDMTTPVGFLELLFVDFGLVLVGLAAAMLVAEPRGRDWRARGRSLGFARRDVGA